MLSGLEGPPHPWGNQTRGTEPGPRGLGRGVGAEGAPGHASQFLKEVQALGSRSQMGGAMGMEPGLHRRHGFLLSHQLLSVLLLKHIRDLAGFPGGSDSKSVCLPCGRPRFDPWVGKIPWRRRWQLTPVPLPGRVHGRRCLVGCSPWGCRVGHD